MTEGEVLGGVARAGRIGRMRAPRPRIVMMVRRRAPARMPGMTIVMTVVITGMGIPVPVIRTMGGRGSLKHRRSRADSRERRATLRRECASVWLIFSQWCLSAAGI
jgi:hypothetical protein